MLSEREQKVLDYLKQTIQEKGYAPSFREIGAALGIKSTSTVYKDIENLARAGYLVKDQLKKRAISIVEPENESSTSNEPSNIVNIPIVGRVAAGTPILAEQNIEDTFPVPANYVKGGTNFMLKVRGESMIEAGIMDGDLILVQQQDTAYNGEIVVAMIDGFESEATVKTFYKENGYIRLQPENHTMSPIIVKDAKIVGKVKGVFRYYN